MPQRRNNAGAECDFDMGMLFLNRQFLSYRRLATAPKNGVEFRIISIICLFELAIEFNFSPECGIVDKLSIFVIQKATAPKNGVEFRQDSIGTIRSSPAMSYDVWQRRQFSTKQRPRNYLRHTHTQTQSSACKIPGSIPT